MKGGDRVVTVMRAEDSRSRVGEGGGEIKDTPAEKGEERMKVQISE